jgi:hypothetical protein
MARRYSTSGHGTGPWARGDVAGVGQIAHQTRLDLERIGEEPSARREHSLGDQILDGGGGNLENAVRLPRFDHVVGELEV